MPGRTFSSSSYRYGFNGMEKDNEVTVEGGNYSTDFREYDSRIARWLILDPKLVEFPWQSPYVALDNNPLNIIDPTGESGTEPEKYKVEKGNTLSGIAAEKGTTVDEILKINPTIKDPNKIKVGQEILLPARVEDARYQFCDNCAETVGNLMFPQYDQSEQATGKRLARKYSYKDGVGKALTKFDPDVLSGVVLPIGGIGPKPLASTFSYIGTKIKGQFSNRGWSTRTIHQTVNKPFTTRSALNKANGNSATAYYTKAGGYVVRDNVTGEIIQISNLKNPGSWVPDQTIINPYRP